MIYAHRLGAVACLAALVLAACAPSAPAAPTTAPAPTAAPAATSVPKPAATAASSQSAPSAVAAPSAAPSAAAQPAASAVPSSPVPAANGPTTKVTLGQVGGVSDAAFFIAVEKGYFKEQGIEIDASRFNSAAQMVAPLGTGQLDVGGGAPGAGLFNAIARDVPLRIVADKGRLSPGHGFEALVVRKALWDSGEVRKVADLKGRTVALAANDIAPEVTLATTLKSGGLTVGDVNVTTMGHPDMVAALANGAIDAGQPIEPFLSQALDKNLAVVLERDDVSTPNHQTAVVLYSPKLIADRPDLARKFMVAYLKGVRDYDDAFDKKDPAKRQEIVPILMKATGITEPTVWEKMVMPGIDPNGRVNADSLSAQQDYFLNKGSQKTKVDMATAIDNQYVDYAVQQLGPYR